MPNPEWRRQRSDQPFSWQRGGREITKSLSAVCATRFPGWGVCDPHCACLETLPTDVSGDLVFGFSRETQLNLSFMIF
ncbi:hypothetical protein T265_04635 [Opisthorchis viverrini]|uniref:Uncharacterized protein n=1 Tax=Opisthorchis viverrini TaxID=6198 RepID=A0A074ZRY6_OPIVI|nr:hypothetical protein T265_04635 [Opisthorchis viverrini]KER28592.1 hypothetical protein T265_04635 [Opisthorchis viverrini]